MSLYLNREGIRLERPTSLRYRGVRYLGFLSHVAGSPSEFAPDRNHKESTTEPGTRNRFCRSAFYRIRRPVTNDSIALRGGPLTWGTLVRIRFAVLRSIQAFRSESARIVLFRTRTANCELHMHGRTDETPTNLIRVWCEVLLQIANARLSFFPCILKAFAGIGFRGMCELLRPVPGFTVQFALWKRTRTFAQLPLTALPQGAQVTVFVGR